MRKGTGVEKRRRVPRQAAGWQGQCAVGTDPDLGWEDCRVVDISVLGAAVLVGDAPMSDLAGKTLTVRVAPLTGGSVSLTFVGAVRNVTARVGTGMRIGIEFVGLSEMERSIMNALEVMEAVW